MAMSQWRRKWDSIQQILVARGATGRWAEGIGKPPRFEVHPPASEDEVLAVESILGQQMPQSMRRVLLEFSARVCIEWALPKDIQQPESFRQVWAGECRWDLKSLPALHQEYKRWIDICFTGKPTADWDKPPEAIAYDLVWHHKLPFLEVGNGDMIGIDIASEGNQPVVYLSHEDGPCHGYRLGSDFEDYVERLTALAFVGAEDCQLASFLPDATNYLHTENAVAAAWRRWLGVPGETVLEVAEPLETRSFREANPPAVVTEYVFTRKAKGPPCPKCGKRLRTAKAQQCFSCGAKWHGKSPPGT